MRAKRTVTIAVVALLVLGGTAALGTAAPADVANHNGTDAHDERPDDASEADGSADDRSDTEPEGADNADGVGPSDGLPEAVPDHVRAIHASIESFLGGSNDSLGESLSDLLSGGDAADNGAVDAADNASNASSDGVDDA